MLLHDLADRGLIAKTHSFRAPTPAELAVRNNARVRTLRLVNPRKGTQLADELEAIRAQQAEKPKKAQQQRGEETRQAAPVLVQKVDVWQWEVTDKGRALLELDVGTDAPRYVPAIISCGVLYCVQFVLMFREWSSSEGPAALSARADDTLGTISWLDGSCQLGLTEQRVYRFFALNANILGSLALLLCLGESASGQGGRGCWHFPGGTRALGHD